MHVNITNALVNRKLDVSRNGLACRNCPGNEQNSERTEMAFTHNVCHGLNMQP